MSKQYIPQNSATEAIVEYTSILLFWKLPSIVTQYGNKLEIEAKIEMLLLKLHDK
jgi:hypothetical protein